MERRRARWTGWGTAALLALALAIPAAAGAVSGSDTISTLLAGVNDPQDVAPGPDGALYTASQDHVVRRIAPDGTVTVVAGTGTAGFSGDGGPAALAQMSAPGDVAFDALGRMYIADQVNNRIRRVGLDGRIATIAGGGTPGIPDFGGDGGPATAALLGFPEGVAVDAAGNVFIADLTNNRVRRLDGDGVITTYAGTGAGGFNGDGLPASATQLNGPARVEIGPDGALYVADSGNARVRRIDPLTTVVTTVHVGPGEVRGLTFDRAGNLYVSETSADRVRRRAPDGSVTVVAGTGVAGFSGDGGPADLAQLAKPRGLGVDRDGSLIIAEIDNGRFREVTNLVPTARATAAPLTGAAPLSVSLDGGASSDPNGAIVAHRWELGDGASASGPVVTHRYAAAGGYRARLTVMDDSGAEATAEVQVAATAPPRCRTLPAPPAPGAEARFDLSVRQLRINQRIYSAALRRARAIEDWLAAGVVARDLCGGGLPAAAFGAGVITGFPAAARPIGPPAAPRPVVVPRARPGSGRITLSVRQLRINQAIAARAVREANALAARLDAGLTGGDVADGVIGRDAIDPTLDVVAATPVARPPAASRTIVAPPSGRRATFRLTAPQLATNQRIGQAAIRRLNAIVRRLEAGLDGGDFRPGSLTAIDLEPGLRR